MGKGQRDGREVAPHFAVMPVCDVHSDENLQTSVSWFLEFNEMLLWGDLMHVESSRSTAYGSPTRRVQDPDRLSFRQQILSRPKSAEVYTPALPGTRR
jgi:hypothetical protein